MQWARIWCTFHKIISVWLSVRHCKRGVKGLISIQAMMNSNFWIKEIQIYSLLSNISIFIISHELVLHFSFLQISIQIGISTKRVIGFHGTDKLEYGKGQGNPNVSKIHSGHWRINEGVISNYLPWAAEHVNSSDSSYMQYDGRLVTYDDKMGAAIDGKIVDWGQPGHTEGGGKMDVPNPNIGKDAAPPTNPSFTGGATNSDLAAIWPNVDWSGGQGDAGGDTGPEQYPYWT